MKVVPRPGAWIKLDGTGGAVVCEVDAREEEVRIISAARGSRTSLAMLRVPGSGDLFRAVAVVHVEVHHGYPFAETPLVSFESMKCT